MASKTKHTADPAALSVRVWVIETREKGGHGKWSMFDTYPDDFPEWKLIFDCKRYSENHTDYEIRYRAATLTFDDDGSKCTIY